MFTFAPVALDFFGKPDPLRSEHLPGYAPIVPHPANLMTANFPKSLHQELKADQIARA